MWEYLIIFSDFLSHLTPVGLLTPPRQPSPACTAETSPPCGLHRSHQNGYAQPNTQHS
jgi:hypothetical protein